MTRQREYGIADTDLSATRYLALERDTDSNNRLQLPAAARQSTGIVGAAEGDSNVADAAGDVVSFGYAGKCRCTAGEALQPFDTVTFGSDGKAYKALPGDVQHGQFVPHLAQGATNLPPCAAEQNIDVYLFDNKATRRLDGGLAVATFDATDGKVIGTHLLDAYIPDNALIIRTGYEVLTTFTSATDAGTIALGVATDVTFRSALAISNGANPFDAGLFAGAQTGYANAGKTTAQRQLQAVVAVEALTAGILRVYAEWVLSI